MAGVPDMEVHGRQIAFQRGGKPLGAGRSGRGWLERLNGVHRLTFFTRQGRVLRSPWIEFEVYSGQEQQH